MRDPYAVLGLSKDASTKDIKKAYRTLAKKYHPDTSKGDDEAARKFSELSAAYDLLTDKDKRGQFDRGEIDAEGNPTFKGYNPFGGGAGPQGGGTYRRWSSGGGQQGGGFGADDIFAEIFGGFGQGGQRAARGGQDVTYRLKVSFLEAAKGERKRVTMPNGKTLDVNIPAGVAEGQQIRLRGQGDPGPGGGPAGDALITIGVELHPLFERDGNDIRLELPVTLYEAVLGAKIRVPTLEGSVELKIPANSSSGRTLRLKGKGIAAKGESGDQLVVLRVMLPKDADERLETLARELAENAPYAVRDDKFGNNS